MKRSELQSLQTKTVQKQRGQERFLDEEEDHFQEDRLRNMSERNKHKYNTVASKPAAQHNPLKTSSKLEQSECESYYKSMQELMSEKEKLNQRQDEIRKNKFLKLVDRNNAIKSVRSLSRTIDDLIQKEKQKIDEHYNHKLEKSRISNLE